MIKLERKRVYRLKVINRLSISIIVVNSMTKKPINNAVISHNGKLGGYISKGEGYYIFNNLESYVYNFKVECQGFITESFEVDLKENDGVNHVCEMYYSVDSAKLLAINKPVALVTLDGKPLVNTPIKFIQEDKVAALRVTRNIEKGSKFIELNCDYDDGFLYQSYTYEDNERELFINDYDVEKSSYVLEQKTDEDLKLSTLLKPLWNISTDENGMLVVPISDFFVNSEEITFTVKYKDFIKTISVKQAFTKDILSIDF